MAFCTPPVVAGDNKTPVGVADDQKQGVKTGTLEQVNRDQNAPDSISKSIVLSGGRGPNSYICSAVLTEAYKRLGYKLQFKFIPAQRSLLMASQGKTDGEINRIHDLNKRKHGSLIKVPVPIGQLDAVVVSSKSIEIKNWASLKPYTIGYRRGNQYIEEATEGMDARGVSSNSQLHDLLLSNRYEVVVMPRFSALVVFKGDPVKVLDPPLLRSNYYHYLHERHKLLVPEIEKVLKKMAAEGTIKAITRDAFEKLLEKRSSSASSSQTP